MFKKITKQCFALILMIIVSGSIITSVQRFFHTEFQVFYFFYTFTACWMLMYMDKFYREHLE